MIHDFTTLVELELKNQDAEIKDVVAYLKDNLSTTVRNEILDMFKTNQVTLEFDYNRESEELNISGIVVVGGEE